MAARTYKDGEIIFREGDVSDIAFVIEKGKVELTKASDRDPVQLALLKRGEMFGEMGILDNSTRSATATAVGKTTLKIIDREAFLGRLEKEPEMALSVINKLVERLRHADELLVQRPARAAVSKVRREGERPARPGIFRRLFGSPEAQKGETVEVWVAQLAGEGGEEAARKVTAILDRHKNIRARVVKQVLEPDPALDEDRQARVLAETGRQWLRQKKGDLLVWGVLPPPGTTMHLRFISAFEDKTDRPGTFSPTTTLAMPLDATPEFGQLLIAVTLAATAMEPAERMTEVHRALPEALEAALAVAREMPAGLVSRERAAIQTCYGNAVATAATLNNSVELYQVAANAYRAGLEGLSVDSEPLEWGMVHKHLGCVLQVLAERTNDPETMGAAANVFRSALRVLDRQGHPFDWGCIQYRLGQVLYRLDLKTGDTDLLKEALGSFQSALQVFRRQDDPVRWAEIMNGIAQTAQVLGRELRNVEILEKAAEACDSALEIRTRIDHPQDYAATQNNLGSALFLMGRMTGQDGYFREAARAFQEAKETYDAEGLIKLAEIAARNLSHVEDVMPGGNPAGGRKDGPPAWFEEGGEEET